MPDPRDESGWLPIETAPKDKVEFQAWMTRAEAPEGEGWWEPRCRYNHDEAFEIWGRVDYDCDGWDSYPHCIPVVWMPLPTAPAIRTGDHYALAGER